MYFKDDNKLFKTVGNNIQPSLSAYENNRNSPTIDVLINSQKNVTFP